MTRTECVAKLLNYVTGTIALGTTEYRASLKEALTVGGVASVEAHGQVLASLRPTAEALIGRIYDAITASTDSVNGTNGHANGNGAPKRMVMPEKVG